MKTLNNTDITSMVNPVAILRDAKSSTDIANIVRELLLPESNLTPNKELLENIWSDVLMLKRNTLTANELYIEFVGEVLPNYVTHPQVEAWMTCKLLENIAHADFFKEVSIDDIIEIFETSSSVANGPAFIKDLYEFYKGKTSPLRDFATSLHESVLKATVGKLYS